MIVIVGDKFQGKLAYVQSNYSYADDKILNNFQDYVRNNMHKSVQEIVDEIIESGIKILIADNINGGIVPLDADDRRWQEHTGRAVALLCSNAEKVVRIHSGLPQILKGEICW